MIAKGNLHAHGVKLAAYLTTGYGHETAELVELRGFAANNIRDAFIDVQMQAAATQAEKPFFHAYARLPKFEAEKLTRENWLTFADRLEKRLGFDDQPRAVAFHHQANGDMHMHIAWSRIDLESLTAIDPGLYKNKMKQLCREFEQEFGLTKVPNERGKDVKTKSAARAEFEQSRRLGIDLKAIRNAIQECWQSADSGQAFTSALAEHGLILAKGDRRDYVIIDREGGDHALSKRITGATAAATRQRMADIDRATLPSVEDAKASQRERNDRQRATTEAQATTAPDPQQARKAPARNEAETLRLDTGPVSAAAQRDRLVREAAQLAEAERVQTQMHSARNYREQLEREAEEARKGKGKKEGRESDASLGVFGGVANARSRYAQALSSTYSFRDPYGSLAAAAMAEYGSFRRQQDALRKEAGGEQDPDKRRLIDLRREIEGHDYMAITSERLAGISRAITMGDNDGAQRDNALAKAHTTMAQEKRQERAELQRELRERAKGDHAATERPGLGSVAERGAAAPERRSRSPVEEASRKAGGSPERDRPDGGGRQAGPSPGRPQGRGGGGRGR